MELTLDLDAGRLSAGATAWPVDVTPEGVRIAGGGPALAPVSWGERTRAVTEALGCAAPETALARRLLAAATRAPGEPSAEAELLALHMAGAGGCEAPFTAALIAVARATGWGPEAMLQMASTEVDELATALLGEGEGDWTTVRFTPAADDGPVSAAELRTRLARGLLARGRGAAAGGGARTAPAAGQPAGDRAAVAQPGPASLAELRGPGPGSGRRPGAVRAAVTQAESGGAPRTAGPPLGPGPGARRGSAAGASDPPGLPSQMHARPAAPRGGLDAFAAALGAGSAAAVPSAPLPAASPPVARRPGRARGPAAGSQLAIAPAPPAAAGLRLPAVHALAGAPAGAAPAASARAVPVAPSHAVGVAAPARGRAAAAPRSPSFDDGVLADELAALLDAEADLRGIDP